jgi:hypothetical protein
MAASRGAGRIEDPGAEDVCLSGSVRFPRAGRQDRAGLAPAQFAVALDEQRRDEIEALLPW